MTAQAMAEINPLRATDSQRWEKRGQTLYITTLKMDRKNRAQPVPGRTNLIRSSKAKWEGMASSI
jgi:hypothetical protein